MKRRGQRIASSRARLGKTVSNVEPRPGHERVRCAYCDTDFLGATIKDGISLTPGQRKTLARAHEPEPKWHWWYTIFGPPRDERAYWQGR